MRKQYRDKIKSAGLVATDVHDLIDRTFIAEYEGSMICGLITGLGIEAALTLKLFVSVPSGLCGAESKAIDCLTFTENSGWSILFRDHSTVKISKLFLP